MRTAVTASLFIAGLATTAVAEEEVADADLDCTKFPACFDYAKICVLQKGAKVTADIMRCVLTSEISDLECKDCVDRKIWALCQDTPVHQCDAIDEEADGVDPCFGKDQGDCPMDKCNFDTGSCQAGASEGGAGCENPDGSGWTEIGGWFNTPCEDGLSGLIHMRCKQNGKFTTPNDSKCKATCVDRNGGEVQPGKKGVINCTSLGEGYEKGKANAVCGNDGDWIDVDTKRCKMGYVPCQNPEEFGGYTDGATFAEYPCEMASPDFATGGTAYSYCTKSGEWDPYGDNFNECSERIEKCEEGSEDDNSLGCAAEPGCLSTARKCVFSGNKLVADIMHCVIGDYFDGSLTDTSCRGCIEDMLVEACGGNSEEDITDECVQEAAEGKSTCDTILIASGCSAANCMWSGGRCVDPDCMPSKGPCGEHDTDNPRKYRRMSKNCRKDKKNKCSWNDIRNECMDYCWGKPPISAWRMCGSFREKESCQAYGACRWEQTECKIQKKQRIKCNKLSDDVCCRVNGCYLAQTQSGMKCMGKFKPMPEPEPED